MNPCNGKLWTSNARFFCQCFGELQWIDRRPLTPRRLHFTPTTVSQTSFLKLFVTFVNRMSFFFTSLWKTRWVSVRCLFSTNIKITKYHKSHTSISLLLWLLYNGRWLTELFFTKLLVRIASFFLVSKLTLLGNNIFKRISYVVRCISRRHVGNINAFSFSPLKIFSDTWKRYF